MQLELIDTNEYEILTPEIRIKLDQIRSTVYDFFEIEVPISANDSIFEEYNKCTRLEYNPCLVTDLIREVQRIGNANVGSWLDTWIEEKTAACRELNIKNMKAYFARKKLKFIDLKEFDFKIFSYRHNNQPPVLEHVEHVYMAKMKGFVR